MANQKLKLGLGLLAAALVAAGISALVYVHYLNKAADKESGPPKTAWQLRRLVKKIAYLDAPNCKNIDGSKGDPEKLWLDCFKQSYEDASLKMFNIDQPKLVPGLIKIATRNDFRVPRRVPKDSAIRRSYRLLRCSIRFTAIQTLGKLADPRAIDPLIKIMSEPYDTDCIGCYFGSSVSVCTVAAKELVKFEDRGITQKLLRIMDEHPYKTHEDIEDVVAKKRAGGQIEFEAEWVEYQDTNISECVIEALGRMGDEGRKALLQKLKTGDLDSAQLQLFLKYMGKSGLDQESFDLIKKYLTYESKPVQKAAAEALARAATKQRKDFYLTLYNQGYYQEAAVAFGKIKTPDLAPLLAEILGKTDDEETAKAVFQALKEFKPEEIRPALPALLKKMKGNENMLTNDYYDVIKKARDPSAIKDLVEMLHNPKMSMGIQVDTIAMIGGPQAKAALGKIIEDRNFPQSVIGSQKFSPDEEKDLLERLQRIRGKSMYWYLVLEGEGAKPYCAKYFDQKTVDGAWRAAEAKRKQLGSEN
jgi:HEAT repeat protein